MDLILNNHTTEIIKFIEDYTGSKKVFPDTDIMWDCGIDGDDCHELIEAYAKKFRVNMDNYLWFFHCNEEGLFSFGELSFAPPYKQVQRIPVTPGMLADFAKSGNWSINYPSHEVKKQRYDVVINQIIFYATLLCAIIALFYKYAL